MIIHVIIMIMIMMINTYWMIMEIEEDNTLQDIHNSSDDK